MMPARTLNVLFFVIAQLFVSCAFAEVRLPKILASGMVLQRGVDIELWGWADPGEKITAELAGRGAETRAGKDGSWQLTLPEMNAGGPYTITIKGDNQLVLEDVLIGDVWLASGQSNMELTLARAQPRFPQEVAAINEPTIRQFEVPDRYNFKAPQQDLESGQWLAASQDNILSFSAVGYFFAERVQQMESVPIGIINASLGGSPIEAWISEPTLKQFEAPYQEAVRFRDDQLIEQITQSDQQRMNRWYQQLNEQDRGFNEGRYLWAQRSLNTKDWQPTQVPGYWKDTGVSTESGVVWFRKTFEVPKAYAGREALLVLGAIVDADQVFVNGTQVGATTYMYPPRRYSVPAKVLGEGTNTITVRVTSGQGRGGFVPDKEYALHIGDHEVDLTGTWQYKRGATMPALASQTFIRWKPLGLFNAMIAPLTQYPIKGVIWYQGESNAGRAEEYKQLFPALINDWRAQWAQGDFPFLFVQLANYVGPGQPRDEVGNWPELREAQLQTLEVPGTAMVVTIDVGEWNDIHPLDKRTVGYRLAAAAGREAYGGEGVYSGPIFSGAKLQGDRIRLRFDHVGSGLLARGESLEGFTIAGADEVFEPAQAKIEGDEVVVWREGLAQPLQVRYAWRNNPEAANLYNREGFPASPFRASLAKAP